MLSDVRAVKWNEGADAVDLPVNAELNAAYAKWDGKGNFMDYFQKLHEVTP